MFRKLEKRHVILLVALAIFSLGASSCDRQEKDFDFWYLEITPEYRFQWCVPIEVEGKEVCEKTMTLTESHKKGMIGTTTEDFEELVMRYNKLKRDCGK